MASGSTMASKKGSTMASDKKRFGIAGPFSEDSSLDDEYVRGGTTIVGILRPGKMVICSDGRLTESIRDTITNINEDMVKIFSLTDSVVGGLGGDGDMGNRILKAVKRNLSKPRNVSNPVSVFKNVEIDSPTSMEELAGCIAAWANLYYHEDKRGRKKNGVDIVIGGRFNAEEAIQMYSITSCSSNSEELEEAVEQSSIASKAYRSIIDGPYVPHANSVVATGRGGPTALNYLLEVKKKLGGPDRDNEDLMMRVLAKDAVLSACTARPSCYTSVKVAGHSGGTIRLVSISDPPGPPISYHASYPTDNYSRIDEMDMVQFGMLRGKVKM